MLGGVFVFRKHICVTFFSTKHVGGVFVCIQTCWCCACLQKTCREDRLPSETMLGGVFVFRKHVSGVFVSLKLVGSVFIPTKHVGGVFVFRKHVGGVFVSTEHAGGVFVSTKQCSPCSKQAQLACCLLNQCGQTSLDMFA